MAGELITLAEHARRCGVSKPAVTKWKAQGRLVLVNGLVDHEASYRGEGQTAMKAQRHREKVAAAAPAPVAAPAPAPATKRAPVVKTVAPPAGPPAPADIKPASPIATALAEKERELVRKHQRENDRADGLLIRREHAERVLFDLARAARDAWLSFSSRYAARIAADLSVEDAGRVAAVLDTYIHRQVAALGEPPAEAMQEQ